MDGRFIIDNLLRQEKNERLDFLPKATEDMLAKTITAMLNNRGGDIGYVHRLLLIFTLLIIMELIYCL